MRYALLLLLLLILPMKVQAQEVSLGLSPLKHQIIAKPGTRIELPYALANYGDATLVTVTITRLESADSLGNYTLLPLNATDTPEPQLSIPDLSEGPFLLLSEERYTGTIVVEIPAETKEQDYYFAIQTTSEHSQGFETSSAIKIHGGVAIPIFITVSKTGIQDQQLSDPDVTLDNSFSLPFFTNIPLLDSNIPVSGHIYIQNTGKNITDVIGKVIITRTFTLLPFGGFQAEIPHIDILSGARKSLRLPQIDSMPAGRYVLTTSLTSGTQTVISHTSFILFPFRLTAYFMGILLLAILGFALYKRYTNT